VSQTLSTVLPGGIDQAMVRDDRCNIAIVAEKMGG
jgi:hypothetical protein